MPITNNELFEKASLQLTENSKITLRDYSKEISDLMVRLEIITDIHDNVSNYAANKVFNEVSYDLFISVYLAMNGLYRNAFISLRSASELGAGFYYFLDYNYHFQKWQKKKYDLQWSVLIDDENGILSEKYLKTFLPFEKTSELITDYKQIYRNCSEYVHGKHEFMHTLNSPKIVFDANDFLLFVEEFTNLTICLFSLFAIRFNNILPALKEENYIFLRDNLKKYSLNNLIQEYGK